MEWIRKKFFKVINKILVKILEIKIKDWEKRNKKGK